MHTPQFAGLPAPFPRTLEALLAPLQHGISHIEQSNYPPHNIYRSGENDFHIEIAVAGFSPEEIDISLEQNTLKVSGAKEDPAQEEDRVYLHRGLAQRNFRRSYRLGAHVIVRDAAIRDGILTINLGREIPEEAKPRTIEIKSVN